MKRKSWNWHLLACQKKGAKAFHDGLKKADCPYGKESGLNSNLTKQRVRYWLHGWELAARNQM